MIAQAAAPSRYHALDARAAMMFLGIYLHGGLFAPRRLAIQAGAVTTALDYTVGLIHVFRMPVFYVMAGFFAALLLARYGFARAAENRFWRIVVPFVVGCIILYPILVFLLALGRAGLALRAGLHPLRTLPCPCSSGASVVPGISARALRPGDRRCRGRSPQRVGAVGRSVPIDCAVGVGAVASCGRVFPRLATDEMGRTGGSAGLHARARIVVAYATPFAFGWLLYVNTDLLDMLKRRAWLYTAAAVPASLVYLGCSTSSPSAAGTSTPRVHPMRLPCGVSSSGSLACSFVIWRTTARCGAISAICRTSSISPTCRSS